MTFEVREIGIRLAVGDSNAEPPAKKKAAPASEGCGAQLGAAERASIVRECVAAALAEIERRSER